jgi:flagellar basal-body rod modification protein FlgD
MTIDAIGATPSTDNSNLSQSTTINQKDFLQIMLTQLKFQDPLKPMDNQQFVAQLAQFSALELSREQKVNTDTLLAVQSNTQSIDLLGRSVEFYTGTGSATAVGTVTAVSINNGSPSLTINGANGQIFTTVSPSRILLVRPTSGN